VTWFAGTVGNAQTVEFAYRRVAIGVLLIK